MELRRFTGPTTKARRQFWDSVWHRAMSLRRNAGANINVTEHPGEGTELSVPSSALASSLDACLNCDEPSGDCLHVISARVTIDQEEVDHGGLSGDFVDFLATADATGPFGVYFDYGTEEWVAYSDNGEARIANSLTSRPIAGVTHCLQFALHKDGADLKARLCVDGIMSSEWTESSPAESYDRFLAGAYSPVGAISHHSITDIIVTSAVSGENGFTFPGDSFDSFTGGASVVGDDLRVDDDTGSAYAQKDLSPEYKLNCCTAGFEDIPVTTMTVAVEVSASRTQDGCTITYTGSGSRDFTRVGYGSSPGDGEFRFFKTIDANCNCLSLDLNSAGQLIFGDDGFSCDCAYQHFNGAASRYGYPLASGDCAETRITLLFDLDMRCRTSEFGSGATFSDGFTMESGWITLETLLGGVTLELHESFGGTTVDMTATITFS